MADNEKTNGLEQNLLNGFYQSAIGAYHLKRNPNKFGELGHQTGKARYSTAMQSEDAQEMLESEAKKAAALGIDSEDMSYINHDYLFYQIKKIKEQSFMGLSLGQLEKVLKNVVKGFKFEVDSSVSDVSMGDIILKQSEGTELSDAEKYAASVYQYFSDAYDSSLALQQMNQSYVDSLNAQGEKLNGMLEKEE